MEALTYEQHHLRIWIQEHTLINISKLEQLAEVPKDTVRHFLNERRPLPLVHWNNILKVLSRYGYTSLVR